MSGCDWIEYHEQPVTLHSGGQSHWLVNGARLFEHTDLRERIIDKWVGAVHYRRSLTAKGREGYEIVPVPTGGNAWAAALRERLGDGPTNDPIRIIVDDVLTTGGSLGEYAPYDLAVVAVCRTVYHHPALVSWATIPLPLVTA